MKLNKKIHMKLSMIFFFSHRGMIICEVPSGQKQ